MRKQWQVQGVRGCLKVGHDARGEFFDLPAGRSTAGTRKRITRGPVQTNLNAIIQRGRVSRSLGFPFVRDTCR